MTTAFVVGAALAEAGYPDAEVWADVRDGEPRVLLSGDGSPPCEVAWRAFLAARVGDVPCFACWAYGYDDCPMTDTGALACGRHDEEGA